MDHSPENQSPDKEREIKYKNYLHSEENEQNNSKNLNEGALDEGKINF